MSTICECVSLGPTGQPPEFTRSCRLGWLGVGTAAGTPGHIPGGVQWCPQQGCKLGAGRETQPASVRSPGSPQTQPPERCPVNRLPLALGSALHAVEGTNTWLNETRFKNYYFLSLAPACHPHVFRKVLLTIVQALGAQGQRGGRVRKRQGEA